MTKRAIVITSASPVEQSITALRLAGADELGSGEVDLLAALQHEELLAVVGALRGGGLGQPLGAEARRGVNAAEALN